MGLTKRQTELLDFLKAYFVTYGIGPTLNEIATAMGWRSKASAHYAVKALIARGYVRYRLDGRRIELVNTKNHDVRDCRCDGCSSARRKFHKMVIQALEVPAPIAAGDNFKALGLFDRTCWRIGFPKPAHPETRKPKPNVEPAQVAQ